MRWSEREAVSDGGKALTGRDRDDAESRRVRVAIVSPDHWARVMGGAEYQAMLLADRLHERHDVEVSYFVARAGDRTEFESHRVICVGRGGILSRYGNFWDAVRLYRALGDFKPDVIYQRVGGAYTGVSAWYAKRNSIKLIWHVANEADTDERPSLVSTFRRPHHFVERYLLDYGRRRADRIIVQSERQKQLLKKNLDLKVFRVIRNFHPLPEETINKDSGLLICWIANLKIIKSPERLFDIAGYLEDLKNIRFKMIGQPYPEASLQREFERRLSAHDNVDYIGGLTQEEVNRILGRASLLVNTSPREGFSNVFIQAWMREVPVLTLGVNPDQLLDNSNLGGAFEDARELAAAIRELSQQPHRLVSMGNYCRKFARSDFSMNNADELADLIIESTRELSVFEED